MATQSATLRLWPEASASSAARRFLREQCTGIGDDLCDTACLLTSELVTNAFLHGRTVITVAVVVDLDRQRVSVAVRDDNLAELPTILPSSSANAETGRGLAIVNALAGACGVTSTMTGKSVWFRLP